MKLIKQQLFADLLDNKELAGLLVKVDRIHNQTYKKIRELSDKFDEESEDQTNNTLLLVECLKEVMSLSSLIEFIKINASHAEEIEKLRERLIILLKCRPNVIFKSVEHQDTEGN